MNTFAKIIDGHPIDGPQPVEEPEGQLWCEATMDASGDWKAHYVEHAKNLIACVKSRATPNSDLKSSHYVSATCHLAKPLARARPQTPLGRRDGRRHRRHGGGRAVAPPVSRAAGQGTPSAGRAGIKGFANSAGRGQSLP